MELKDLMKEECIILLLPSFIEKAEQQRVHPVVRLCLKVKEKLAEME